MIVRNVMGPVGFAVTLTWTMHLQGWQRITNTNRARETMALAGVEGAVVDGTALLGPAWGGSKSLEVPSAGAETRRGTWPNITGNLPDRHDTWTIVQDHLAPDLLFVGTEFGLFVIVDGGRHWTDRLQDLPAPGQTRGGEGREPDEDVASGAGMRRARLPMPFPHVAFPERALMSATELTWSCADAAGRRAPAPDRVDTRPAGSPPGGRSGG